MIEHVRKDKVLTLVRNSLPSEELSSVLLYQGVNQMESEDVAPVRHGRWIKSNAEGFVCSVCRNGYKNQPTLMGEPMFEYCPVCGARMDR